MDGLISLLIFAGIFYFMMRLGCGAHAVHGQHNAKENEGNDNTHIDPVCGSKVDVNKGYGMMQNGELYRFCSRDCLDKFEVSPDKYIHSKQQGESS